MSVSGSLLCRSKRPSQLSQPEELGQQEQAAAVLLGVLSSTDQHKDHTSGPESTGTLQEALHSAPRGLCTLLCSLALAGKKEKID